MVATEPTTITIAPGGELARILAEAADKPLVLIVDGVRYRVEREAVPNPHEQASPWAAYDPDKLQVGIDAAAGAITKAEAEQWIADVYRWRAEGSRER